MTDRDLVEIGEIQKTHGIRGELTATVDEGVDVSALECIVLQIDGLWVPFFLGSVRRRGPESWLLTIDGVENERDAGELCRHTIYALRADVEDDDTDGDDGELTAGDLVGYRLIDEARQPEHVVGVISDVREMTADNWLFEVTMADGRDVYVPIADDLITDIDHDAETVTMMLPSGLLDL